MGTPGKPDRDAESGPPTPTVAERVELRRVQQGLSTAELAHHARMSPPYLRRLVEDGSFDPDGLARVAAALGTTYDELLHGRADPPPGLGEATGHTYLARLSERECWERLGTHGVGRLGLRGDQTPVILPVNFLVDGRSIVYRTEPGSPAAVESGAPLSFEADHLDDVRSRGWSILVTGVAESVTDVETLSALTRRTGSRPWAEGRRTRWIRVVPREVTGRDLRTR
ncbi:helix-turn-helix domain-containing protein [Streptomyces sp. NPDC002454]